MVTRTKSRLSELFDIAGLSADDRQELDWAGSLVVARCVKQGTTIDPDIKAHFVEVFTPIVEAGIADDELVSPELPELFEQFKREC